MVLPEQNYSSKLKHHFPYHPQERFNKMPKFPRYYPNFDYCSCSPESILGVKYNYGCFLHDRQYRKEVIKRKTRKESDIDLRNYIYRRLRDSNEPFEIRFRRKGVNVLFFKTRLKCFIDLRKKIASPWSKMYYYGVRLFGRGAWQ